MINGLGGTLLSHDALTEARLVSLPAGDGARNLRRWVQTWFASLEREAGPAWPARLVFDRIAAPFCAAVGFEVVPTMADALSCRGVLRRNGRPHGSVLTVGWTTSPGATWRDGVRLAIDQDVRWCYSFTGPALRIFDASRTHARRFVEFDLRAVATRPDTFSVACHVLMTDGALDDAIHLSEQHRVAVRESLQAGVQDALRSLTTAFLSATRRRRSASGQTATDEALVVIYRVLFLLFAEARGLVPTWHPTFRDGYTIEALRPHVETLPRPRGLWEALQAMARLAHRGCRAGTLRVPPFNGRLFSPAHAPLAESLPLDDAAVRNALLALTTRRTAHGRSRISYADLGVEQLGGVYERVLDFDITASHAGLVAAPRFRRKATGTFYTPRSLTEYLVRRTLAPLVRDASSEAILGLRVLDPAMGSGAFLVAACRYLAAAYEAALGREGTVSTADLTDRDRAGFRRVVAQRTLFGVDLNPMAVQLARLSLWLATLSGDRPLTFFDHHLRAGNSLVGASLDDIQRSGAWSAAGSSHSPLPLLDALEPLEAAVASGVTSGRSLREALEDTIEQVRAKETLFSRLQSPDAPLGRWKALADLWCAAWFTPRAGGLNRATFNALVDALLGRPGGLPSAAVNALLERGREASLREGYFHWHLEFPEVFYDADGCALPHPGFDAVLGNPPWEMLRGDEGDPERRGQAAADGTRLTRFARRSGIYRYQGSGHANLYQLFVERSAALVRKGGRVGLVLPSGFATDHGCGDLRRFVLNDGCVDSMVIVENRNGLFPIHRGLKFVLVTTTRGEGPTRSLPVRTGLRTAGEFDNLPDSGVDADSVGITRTLIERISGPQLAIPELRAPIDATIIGRIVHACPAAADPDGWGLKFGRELNATDDREHFDAGEGLPVIEGKHIEPFAAHAAAARWRIAPETAERVLKSRPFDRDRLTYRDVAAATNRLTLIAAIVPAGVVTTHTLFCLKTVVDPDAQLFLLGVFNSFVANYIARTRVSTHVTVAIVERLPLPKPARSAAEFGRAVQLAERLTKDPHDEDAMANLQALVARLYSLDRQMFVHVLSTFPLIDERTRAAALDAFTRTL